MFERVPKFEKNVWKFFKAIWGSKRDLEITKLVKKSEKYAILLILDPFLID